MWCFKLAATLVVFGLALVARSRCAAAADLKPAATVVSAIVPVVPLATDPELVPLPKAIRTLRPSVPGPDGTSVWGASLALPFRPRPSVKGSKGKSPLSLHPTPEIEVGFRSLGKSMGASVQYVTTGGVRLGPGLYFNKIAPGMPSARQAMLVLQIPLPF
jgi:hypothetical protein